MHHEIEILLFKPFQRLRNKAQLFSGLAEDHFHTRMLHSFEVEKISIMIANKLIANNIVKNIDFELLSSIALLHDIGHTPYGHIGERTIHSICSGKRQLDGIDNFLKLDVQCGFKHNINSAVLYKEELIKQKHSITDFDINVLDGIVKHSKLFYIGKVNRRLNYGFEYLNATLKPKINFSATPSSLEGKIIFFADEISQIISDYRDLKNSKAPVGALNRLKVFQNIKPNTNLNQCLVVVANDLVDLFVSDCSITLNFLKLCKLNTAKLIKKFDDRRTKIIKKYQPIAIHDRLKENHICELYRYFFLNPKADNEIYKDFLARINRANLSEPVLKKVKQINNPTSLYNFLFNSVMPLCRNKRNLSSNIHKSYKKIYSLYVWSIGIYVSKMTDNFADHKIEKIAKTAL